MKEDLNPIQMVVVEAWEPNNSHLLICAREVDKHIWHNFYIRQPTGADFGSHLTRCPDSSLEFGFKLILDRGPFLKYTLHCDAIPEDLLKDIMADKTYEEMYPGEASP